MNAIATAVLIAMTVGALGLFVAVGISLFVGVTPRWLRWILDEPKPEISDRAADAIIDFMLLDAELRGRFIEPCEFGCEDCIDDGVYR